MLNPRAIAIQGIGYGDRLVAVQGLSGVGGGVIGPLRLPVPMNLRRAQRERLLSEDELMLFMTATVIAAGLLN